jgi:D-3-phosphoglycerate dehydrogenase
MANLSYSKDKMKVVLLENIHVKALDVFHEQGFSNVELLPTTFSTDELIKKIHDAHVVGIRSVTHLTKEVLAACPKLKVIGCFCIGTNQVDTHDAMMRGIPVFNDPHSNTRSVAELIIGLCIALARDIVVKNNAAHLGIWKKYAKGANELRGKTLGIIGYGRIGLQVSILAEALGMTVYYYDIEQKLAMSNVKAVSKLEDLLKISDFVTLHVPETKLTINMINKDRLKHMKKSAFLINTSRGKVVNIDDLADALKNKQIKGAAVDVFDFEPEDPETLFENKLQKIENAILTPHIGGATEEAQESIGIQVAQKLIYFIDRGNTEGAMNFPTLALAPNENTHRILHVHNNIPGMLSHLNKIFADRQINILAQYLKTYQEIGYVVTDIEKTHRDHLLDALKGVEGTICTRILY